MREDGGLWEFSVYGCDREGMPLDGARKLGTVRARWHRSNPDATMAVAHAAALSKFMLPADAADMLVVPVAMVCEIPECPAGAASRVHANDAERMKCTWISERLDDPRSWT